MQRRAAILFGILVACCPCASALNPSLDINQYAHFAWTIREGFFKGIIYSIAQTPDGYLWLGTEYGLLRFDGVRLVPFQLPYGERLPSNNILKLLATRDGRLWIGTDKGLASWKGGKLTQYPELAGRRICALVEDRAGTVWAGTLSLPPPSKLCAIQKSSVRCYGEDGALGPGVLGLFEDSKGNLWAGVVTGLWRWNPGPPKFYPLPGEPAGIQGLAEGGDGALLISTRGGVIRFVAGKTELVYPLPGSVRQFQALRLLRDRDGGLWIGTFGRGLVHVHQGRTDVFAQSDGLSGDDASNSLFEDREGNIWVATSNGLDRFRDFGVARFAVNQGLSNPIGPVLAGRDGSIWLDTFDGLSRWDHGQVTIYRDRSDRSVQGAPSRAAHQGVPREITSSGLTSHGLQSLFQDDRGRIWVTSRGRVGYLGNDRFTSIKGIPGGEVPSIAEDTGGHLWIANQNLGLFRLFRGSDVQQITWARLGRKDYATALAADPFRGGLWLGFFLGGVAYFADGQVQASYAAVDGLGEGYVNDLHFDSQGTLWAATEGGLSRLQNGRVATLTSKSGLPCDLVHWVMEDDVHSLWLNMPCGLVRIARPELDAWAANRTHTIKAAVFDSSDGMRSGVSGFGHSPHVARSPDGKLWFPALDGLSVVDPLHLRLNTVPPPVHIEKITADGKPYWQDMTGVASSHLRLPPLIRDLVIDYTACSFVAPEKVRFRVRLEGRDPDWKDVGNERKAFYNDLPPRNYRFHVAACNNSGVWNEAGASFDFSIAPAYYQTGWFQALCAAAFVTLLWGLYRYRLRSRANSTCA